MVVVAGELWTTQQNQDATKHCLIHIDRRKPASMRLEE